MDHENYQPDSEQSAEVPEPTDVEPNAQESYDARGEHLKSVGDAVIRMQEKEAEYTTKITDLETVLAGYESTYTNPADVRVVKDLLSVYRNERNIIRLELDVDPQAVSPEEVAR
jgi:hypothetical protein